MVTEIELKAHVSDVKALRVTLSEKADYSYSFEKEDVYWEPVFRFRLRKEKRLYPDGSESSQCLVTWKNKQVIDGIEINEEQEFEAKPAADFETFLIKLGQKPGFSKHKRGWAYVQKEKPQNLGGITAELVEVRKLGWFLELEIVTAGKAGDTGQKANFMEEKNRLLAFLDSLGVERKAIESRFYSEILAEP